MDSVVLSHWHQRFEDMQLSAMDFYQLLYEHIKEVKMPGISLFRVTYAETGLLSARREYLRIQRGEYFFDICAAPFGKNFFISYWLSEVSGCLIAFIALIPLIGPRWARWLLKKTFYQQDTEIMFKETVQALLRDAINNVSDSGRGLRRLAEEEMKPQYDRIQLFVA